MISRCQQNYTKRQKETTVAPDGPGGKPIFKSKTAIKAQKLMGPFSCAIEDSGQPIRLTHLDANYLLVENKKLYTKMGLIYRLFLPWCKLSF